MRLPVSLLAGAALTMALFALLALLVAPPEAEPEPPKEFMMTLAEAPAEQAPEPTVAASAAPPPPPSAPPPPPQPAPAPRFDSAISLPEPELPPMNMPEAPVDEALPALIETPPAPDPEPRPQPEPEPEPLPAPEPSQASADTSLADESSAAVSQAAADEPVDVGSSAKATRRVPPEYPSRAQRRGLEGHVVVQFIIRRDGRVERDSIEVVKASPRNVFDRVARRAIAGWQFAAADHRRRARQRLEFQLR
ncbi:energy transducer TonB [Halomonas sp. YLGW01]|uniref:energy transducer TonB n=1 Tax=Halomonas sp. YLGW01 TaxID=2773308 RepID=UPI00177F46D9|nr:energy transducer TonB [Halomonas sp. YLGW01]